MKKNTSSIRFKLFILPLILIIIAIGSVGLITSNITNKSLIQQMENHSFATARDFVDRIDVDNADLETIQARLERIAESNDVAYALFIDTNLETIAHSNKSEIATKLDSQASKSAAIEGIPYSHQWHYEKENIPVLEVIYPAIIGGQHMGAISMGYPMENTEIAIAKTTKVNIISALIALFIIVFFLFTSSNYAVNLIGQLCKQMELMATGDFTLAVPEDLLNKKDEFGEIARAVDKMQDSI